MGFAISLVLKLVAVMTTLGGLFQGYVALKEIITRHMPPEKKKKQLFILLWFLVAVACVYGASSPSLDSLFPGSSPVAMSTPTVAATQPPSTPSPTTAVAVSPTAPYGSSLLFSDPLQNDNLGRWDSNAGCTFTPNGYSLNATNYYYECAEKIDTFSNVAFQVRIVLTQGSVGGIEFRRIDGEGCYYFSVGWDGHYVFQSIDSNHQDHPIAMGQVAPDSQFTYQLMVVANQSSFQAYINNTSISLPNDSTYTHGSLFLFVDGSPPSRSRTPVTQTTFSDLTVWVF